MKLLLPKSCYHETQSGEFVLLSDMYLFSMLFLVIGSNQHKKIMKAGNQVFWLRYSRQDCSLINKVEKVLCYSEWMDENWWTSSRLVNASEASLEWLATHGVSDRLKPDSGIPSTWSNAKKLDSSQIHYIVDGSIPTTEANLLSMIDKLYRP